MKASLDHTDFLLKAYWALLPMPIENQRKLEKKFRLEFNYNSNHMEGNTLTYGETSLLLFFDKTTGNHQMREYEEMKAHDVAFEMIKEWAKDDEPPLTEQSIKNLHEILLVRPFWKEAITPDGQPTRREIKIGDYKEYPNNVRLPNGEVFEFASVQDTPILMGELIEWLRTEERSLHPITLAAMLHYKFVRIHPFDDGNGRISRLLMNYVLIKNGYPPIVIKSSEKRGYYFALNQADSGDFEPFISYITERVAWSLELAIKAAKNEDIEEPDDWEKEAEIFIKNYDKSKERITKRTDENVVSIIRKSAIPLFSFMIDKFSKWKEVFDSTSHRILFSENTNSRYNFNEKAGGKMLDTTNFPDTTQQWLERYIQNEGKIYDFGLEYSLKAYRRGDPFDISVFINFSFNDYTYIVQKYSSFGASTYVLDKNYSDQLSQTELEGVINNIGKQMLEYLKARTS